MAIVNEGTAIVAVYESIKQVVGISRNVYLIALNAMFMARKVDGGMASGFTAVTTELRGFSDRLDRHMKELSQGVCSLSSHMAMLLKQRRYYDFLCRTREAMEKSAHASSLDEVLLQQGRTLESIDHDFQSMQHTMSVGLKAASQLCDVGEELAVLAKIESVGTGSLAASLSQVSEQIEQTVADIQTALQQAIASLDDSHVRHYRGVQTEIAA